MLRFSDRLVGDRLRTTVGPLSWQVLEPLRKWRLCVEDDPKQLAIDVTWTARSVPWAVLPIVVTHDEGEQTKFAHFFQCGRYEGAVTLDGEAIDVAGWLGARDRSWGVRRTRERLGLHMWIVAYFEDHCLAVHYNEHRDGRMQHCGGALLDDSGQATAILDVDHDIRINDDREFVDGSFQLKLESGETLELRGEGLHRGLYMSGAGYAGLHGTVRGDQVLEHERWVLSEPLYPRALPLTLTDKICRWETADFTGFGMLELAISRSASYVYRPSRTFPFHGENPQAS